MTDYVSDSQGSIAVRWYLGGWRVIQDIGILGLKQSNSSSWMTDSNSASSKDLQWLEWKATAEMEEREDPSIAESNFPTIFLPKNSNTPSSFSIGAKSQGD
jgi:hypothetical protein